MVRAGRFYPKGIPGRMPRLIERLVEGRFGAVPGIGRVQLGDLRLMWHMSRLFQHLHLNRRSPLTAAQREMVATVVNGIIGGAP